tara:strand:+ start:779 stop:2092 length:1314 start_codon:yes stop_codon:yes gene_type:complete
MKDKVICCTPLLAYTLYIVCYGIIDEWSNGCGKMIRPIGHVGILAPFIFMSMCENSIGNIVTYIMCISLAFFNTTNEVLYSVLLVSATYMMSNYYNMQSILMPLALLQLPIAHDSNIQDIFAHCGHIVLLSATGCVFNSNSFILACILAVALVFTHSVRKVSPVIFILCALFSFITKRVPPTEVFTPWIYRTLWECEYGYLTTASVLIYCTTLFSAALEYYCNVDVKLHALHVGGIAAVVIFIFPQVAPQSFGYTKIILFIAGLTDMSILVFKASLNNQYGVSDIIRAISCFTMILGVCITNKPILDHPIIDDSIRIKSSFKEIRLVVCMIYILYSYYMNMGNNDIFISVAHVVHLCFIIGGLAYQAILHGDQLLTFIVRTLLLSEFVGSIIIYYMENTIWNAIDLGKIVLMIIALPTKTTVYKGVLSFDVAPNFHQ